MAHSLWFRQTIYTVLMVAIIAVVVSSFEIVHSYRNEHRRMQAFGDDLIDSFSDAASRAAFHIDNLQAQSVVEGLMKYHVLHSVAIKTDLGVLLAEDTRPHVPSTTDALANWLFSDVVTFKRALSINQGKFIVKGEQNTAASTITVGEFEVHIDATLVGRSFIENVGVRLILLAIEFLLLAAALAFIFYKTMTKPLMGVAEQLGSIDPQGTGLRNLPVLQSHRQDELGLVITRTNELINRIGEQQADLVHREKVAALGSMLAEVAHELNNPLAVVTAQAELLAETATDQKTRDRAEKIIRPAMRCASIVRKFLTLTRQRKIENSVIDTRRLISDSIDMLDYQLNNSNIVVKTEIHPDVTRIWGDRAQLSQVLLNVIINSRQALITTTGNREITLCASPDTDNGQVVISIADNGPGIPQSIQQKVFNHFFTTKPEGRGTGLGLSFSKSIIDGHGGSISIGNVEPHGTKVIIKLPGTTRSAEVIEVRTHPSQALVSLHVLIVDDEESLASTVAEALTTYGHTATVAHSADQAMPLLLSESFDVILSDVRMPGTDGLGFYRNVQKIHGSLTENFVFMTGDSLDPGLTDFFERTNTHYLNKPFEIEELLKVIDQVILSPHTPASGQYRAGAISGV